MGIYFEAGDGDAYNLHEAAEFHRILWERKIPHEYHLVRGADHVGRPLRPRVTPLDAPDDVDTGSLRYAQAFRWTLALLFLGWFAGIIVIDPRREFFGSPFPAVTPNPRQDKLARLQRYAAAGPVRTIVLGSSRAFALAPRDLEDHGFGRSFSLTVHGGGVRDLLALYLSVRRIGVHPLFVILAVDETWLSDRFQDAYELQHNRALQAELAADHRPRSRATHALSLAERIMTPAYALDAARSVRAWLGGGPPRTLTGDDGQTWEPRGDQVIAARKTEASVEISRSVALVLPPLLDYRGADSARVQVLLELVRMLQQDDVTVRAFLTPYHRVALDSIRSRPGALQGFERARADMRALFARTGIILVDFNDATTFGATETEWYDAFHMQAPNGARLIEALVRRGL